VTNVYDIAARAEFVDDFYRMRGGRRGWWSARAGDGYKDKNDRENARRKIRAMMRTVHAN
jgi:hypothetical protein